MLLVVATLSSAFVGPLDRRATGSSRAPVATPAPAIQLRGGIPRAAERTPWDFPRFVRQSVTFFEPPKLLPRLGGARAVRPGDSLGSIPLFPLDDVVMGGASESEFDNARRRWTGRVTTANNGGFVGVRSKALDPPLDLGAASGVTLRVRTPAGQDELRFKFILRDSTDFNGIAHTASFDAGGAGEARDETVRLPFDAFVPTLFARTVPGATLNTRNVVGVQFALSKFEYDGGLSPSFREGAFEMEILDVGTF